MLSIDNNWIICVEEPKYILTLKQKQSKMKFEIETKECILYNVNKGLKSGHRLRFNDGETLNALNLLFI